MFAKFATFLKDDSGATSIEYALIASIMSVALIGGAASIGNQTNNTLTNVSESFD